MMLRLCYNTFGHIYCFFLRIIWGIRDSLTPPRNCSILFVAHPDDDVLFFHSFIKKYKPYVVCMTTGGLLRRIVPFYRAMRYYGVRCRSFDMPSKAVDQEEMIEKRIRKILSNGHFTICATHGPKGEYGHIMHRCIHRCVRRAWDGELLVPVDADSIEQYPLSKEKLDEKMSVLKKYYRREYPTINTFNTWIIHEKLMMIPKGVEND